MKKPWIILIVVIVVIILFMLLNNYNKKQKGLTIINNTVPVIPRVANLEPLDTPTINQTERTSEVSTPVVEDLKVDETVEVKKDVNTTDCASLAYKQVLSLKGMDVQQAKRNVESAILNFNNKKSEINKNKLEAAQNVQTAAQAAFDDHFKKCNP